MEFHCIASKLYFNIYFIKQLYFLMREWCTIYMVRFNIWIIPKMKEYLYNIASQIFVDTINHTPEWRSSHEINSIPISSDQWFLKLFVMFTIIGKYNSYNSWRDKIKRNILLIASYALYSVILRLSKTKSQLSLNLPEDVLMPY